MTIRELAEKAANECWEFMLDTPYTAEGDVDAEVPAMTKIIEAAIREGAKRSKHDGDCSIFAIREGSDCLEQGICCCGFGHQNHWHGGEPEMYSNELLKMIDAKSAKGGEHD